MTDLVSPTKLRTYPGIRRINVDPSTRDIVRKAYEFALNHVGQDKDSGEIWSDYIQFLRSGEVCYDRLLSSCSEIWTLSSCSSYLTFNSSWLPLPVLRVILRVCV